jgi:integrase
VEITPTVVKRYQTDRLAAKAGPKTINDEVLLLLRLCGDQGDLIRAKLRREKAMKLALPPSPGRAYTADEKARMLAEAAKLRSKNMYPALVVDLNCGLRDKELRELRWRQIDLAAGVTPARRKYDQVRFGKVKKPPHKGGGGGSCPLQKPRQFGRHFKSGNRLQLFEGRRESVGEAPECSRRKILKLRVEVLRVVSGHPAQRAKFPVIAGTGMTAVRW